MRQNNDTSGSYNPLRSILRPCLTRNVYYYNFRLRRQRLAFFLSAVGNRCHAPRLGKMLWPRVSSCCCCRSHACVCTTKRSRDPVNCEAALDFSLATIPWAYSACIRKTACETYTNFATLMENPWESTCPRQSVSRDAFPAIFRFYAFSTLIPTLR